MRIFYSAGSDPTVLDTRARLNTLHQQLSKFFASGATEVAIRAEVTHSAPPNQELLKGLRVRKTRGRIELCLTEDRWLELTGSEANLAKYASYFHFGRHEEDVLHHPDDAALPHCLSPTTMHLIIEADAAPAELHATSASENIVAKG
jgi:hypothetical protein